MVQVLPARERKGPTLSEQFASAFQTGIQNYKGYQQEKEAKVQYQQENESVQKLIGKDISGIRDPKIRQMYVEAALQKENKAAELAGKKQEDTDVNRIAAKAFRGEQLTPEEEAKLPASVQAQVAKANKPEKGTQASKPIDPEQLSIIKKVRNTPEYKDASSLEKFQMLTDAGVSKENAHSEADIAAKTQDIEEKKKTETRKEDIKFHEESKDYHADLLKKSQSAKKQMTVIEDAERAVSSGNVKPSSISNIMRGAFGEFGDKIADAYLKKEEATLLSLTPEFLEGKKEIFGVRLSDADLRVVQDKLPSISKDPEANKIILKLMKKYAQLSQLRYEIGAKIADENKGLRPLGYADKIEKRYDEMTKPVRIRNPHTGNVISVPAYEVSEAIDAGGELVNE